MTIYESSPELRSLLSLPERPRLLVVDDQPINIHALYEIFHEAHEVYAATSGQEALDFCRATPPDMILLDVMMPGMDGHEVCRRLKADRDTADIPVIFVTAQSDPADETRALEAGGVDFITKPANPAVVRARVKTHLTLRAQNELLRQLAFIDGLTGLANRRRFDEALQSEWRHCWRREAPLTLLMIDIDYFKRFNDRYGHQAGDACLQDVAATLKAAFGRPHDLVARYGGEEFVCLLPETDLAAGEAKAQVLLADVEHLAIPNDAAPAPAVVTISIGLATAVPGERTDPRTVMALADQALYEAKHAGRNCLRTAVVSAG
ncbi:MAG: diguanylate cyclase [Thauera sp.]|nr:diguanylate cyclase [Thauera sp.]